MRNNVFSLLTALICTIAISCTTSNSTSSLQQKLSDYVDDKDATIGIAVIVDGKDTVAVNGNRPFPMLSVYKLPIVLAYGDYIKASDKLIPDQITLTHEDPKPDTYSPMRDRYAGQDSITVDISEIIAYALQQSDNNASDIILKLMGGVNTANNTVKRLGADNIHIVSTEAEMHESPELCYLNSSTPIAMARMIDRFDYEFDDRFSRYIKQLMETCDTGKNRLAASLSGKDTAIGHKTGTGFTLPDGRLMAVNDAGYVHLLNGHRYSIAVFIENSGYDMDQTEKLIADISAIVYAQLQNDSNT